MNLENNTIKELDLLFELFRINSPSGDEHLIKKFIKAFCKKNRIACKSDKKGNLYLKKGNGVRPCLAAHLDTVFSKKATITPIIVDSNTIIGYDSKEKEQCGLGADDKVGVFLVLKSMLKYKNIKAVLTVEEEIGCLGAKEINLDFFNDVAYVIQADRKGYGDFVIEASNSRYDDIELSSKEFQDDCEAVTKKYGFKHTDGGSTDVVMFKELGLNISVANLSCGYYFPHEETEYVNPKELFKVMYMVFDLIDTLTLKKYTHKAVLSKSSYKNYTGWNSKSKGGYSWYDQYDKHNQNKNTITKDKKKVKGNVYKYHSLQKISDSINQNIAAVPF